MDPADIAALFYGDEASGPEKAQQLAAALRGDTQLGQLGMLTGDKVLGGVGQQLLADAGRREGMMAEAPAKMLRMALEKQQLAKGKSELAEAAAKADPIYGQLAKKFGFGLTPGMTNEQARQALGLAEKAYSADMRAKELNLNREAMRTNREDARTQKEQDKVESDVQGLSKRMENAPGLVRDMGTLAAAAKQEDIPGVGPIAGRLPDFLISDEGLKVRQAARGVVRNIIHETSGTAASDSEVQRIMGELGLKEGGGEEAYRLGLEGLAAKTRALLKAKESGYRPEAVQLARQRGMTTSADVPQYHVGPKPGAALPRATAPTGRVRVSNGREVLEIAASDLGEAEADGFKRVR